MNAVQQVLRASLAETRDNLARGAHAVHTWSNESRVATTAIGRGRTTLSMVSALGWTVLASAFGCWLVGWQCGWVELMLIGTGALALFVACGLLTLGRTRLQIRVDLDPQRVRVGEPAAGRTTATNVARGPLLPILLELPIGSGLARFSLPLLRPAASHEDLFVVPTERRGVIPVGPARTVRGDPLGLLRRVLEWTDVLELFVHPTTVPLEPLGAGLLRDLEGQTTNDLSMSDLAFHALRDYQPGDDRRYIHWRSSAKVSSGGAQRFLVRQFMDTRRSHITTVVDSAAASYGDPDDFETAISVAASIAVRTVTDGQELSVVVGSHVVTDALSFRVLDTFARAEFGNAALAQLSARAATAAPDTSIALLITGPHVSVRELQRASNHFPQEVRVIFLRIDPGSPTGVTSARGLTVCTLQALHELPPLLAGTLS